MGVSTTPRSNVNRPRRAAPEVLRSWNSTDRRSACGKRGALYREPERGASWGRAGNEPSAASACTCSPLSRARERGPATAPGEGASILHPRLATPRKKPVGKTPCPCLQASIDLHTRLGPCPHNDQDLHRTMRPVACNQASLRIQANDDLYATKTSPAYKPRPICVQAALSMPTSCLSLAGNRASPCMQSASGLQALHLALACN